MGLSVNHLASALDISSDYLLIATCPPPPSPPPPSSPSSPSQQRTDDCAANYHDQETCTCERTYFNNILFINSALWSFLGYHIDKKANVEEVREQERKRREELPQKLKGNVRGMHYVGKKVHCRVALENAYGSGIIN